MVYNYNIDKEISQKYYLHINVIEISLYIYMNKQICI